MTINNDIRSAVEHIIYHKVWNDEDKVEKLESYITENYQPKTTSTSVEQYQCQSYYDDEGTLQDCTCGKCGKQTTSTDIEEVKKLIWDSLDDIYHRGHRGATDEINDYYAEIEEKIDALVSNKSELKKEVVREFVKYAGEVLRGSEVRGTDNTEVDFAMDMQMTEMFPDMLKALAEHYLSSNEKEVSK